MAAATTSNLDSSQDMDYSNPAPVAPTPESHPTVVHFPHPDPSQSMNVAFPASMSMDAIEAVSKRIYQEHIAAAASRFAGSASSALGGPEHLTGSGADTMQALKHPLDTLKQLGQGLVSIPAQQAAILDKAKAAYNANDYVGAAAHTINYLLPLIGTASDKAAEQLRNKDYAGALGTVVGTTAPAAFSGGEAAPITSEAEAATAAARQFKPEAAIESKVAPKAAPAEPVAKPASTAPVVPATTEVAPKAVAPESVKNLLKGESGEMKVPFTGAKGPETPDVPTFYSKAEQVANQKVNTGSGDSILSTLRNNGVKESEIQWMGLDDYLQGKPKVSKSDVQQFINEHKISLEETTRGSQRQELQAQRDKAYTEQNKLYEELKYADASDKAPFSVYDWLNSSEEAKTAALAKGNISPEMAAKFRRLDELGDTMNELDSRKATLKEQPTKFEQWTPPGESQNYKELLLRLRDKTQPKIDALNARLSEMANRPSAEHAAHPEWKDEWDSIQKQKNALLAQPEFRQSHFEEPNVLAHVRYDDRTSVDGKKALFLEELQSDWHQKGKQQGYNTGNITGEVVPQKNGLYKIQWSDGTFSGGYEREASARQDMARRLKEKLAQAVPDAPMKNDWHELAMKRMLREAAEKGYDRLAWTTGEQQADRYDLSKHISKVEWHPSYENPQEGKLIAFGPSGPVMHEPMHESKIADYIGKEPAKKLLEAAMEQSETGRRQWRPISGVDLKVGGEWAKALYDRAIPNFLNKYAKKWGAKVSDIDIGSGRADKRVLDRILREDFGTTWADATETQRGWARERQSGGDKSVPAKVHSIEITPAMKKSVMKEGQPISRTDVPQSLDWASSVKQLAKA